MIIVLMAVSLDLFLLLLMYWIGWHRGWNSCLRIAKDCCDLKKGERWDHLDPHRTDPVPVSKECCCKPTVKAIDTL